MYLRAFPVAQWYKNLPAMQRYRRLGFNPWMEKIPWRRAWQPILVFLLGKSHGQRSLVGYSHGVTELDMTELTEHSVVKAMGQVKIILRVGLREYR